MIQSINRNLMLLQQKAVPATRADVSVAQDLLDTLMAHRDHCVGMAANMISVNKRVIVCQLGMLPVAMINPEITAKHDAYQTSEGCLSLSGERDTTRYQRIRVRYLDMQFQPHEQEFTDFAAQIIQHEVDHCEGILI